MANSVDLDEVAHHEPPHQDLCCLQIQLFSPLVLKELRFILIGMKVGLSLCRAEKFLKPSQVLHYQLF